MKQSVVGCDLQMLGDLAQRLAQKPPKHAVMKALKLGLQGFKV